MAKSLIAFMGGYHKDWLGMFPSGAAGFNSWPSGRFSGFGIGSDNTRVAGPTTFPMGNSGDTGQFSSNYTDGALTFAVAPGNTNTSSAWYSVGDSGVGAQITFQIDYVNNVINVWRGTSSGTALITSQTLGTSLARGANAFTPVQLAWLIDPSAGYIFARVGSVVAVNLTSQNTRNTANTRWNRICLSGWTGQTNAGCTCDMGFWNMGGDAPSTLNLEYRASYGPPTGDNSVQFTHNSGSNNFSRVADAPQDGDTSYNSDTVTGHEDKFNISNPLVASGTGIYGLQVHRYSRIDDATPHTMKSRLYSGASVTDGATTNEASSYKVTIDRIDLDPATGLPWAAPLPTINPAYNLVS